LNRKLLAKLPYAPDTLLVTDLDGDEHPKVIVVSADKLPIWVRFPFDKPSLLRFENCRSIWIEDRRSVLKALPVLTADKRLRLLRWKDGKASLEPLPAFPDVPIDEAWVSKGEGTGTVFLQAYLGKDGWVFTLMPQGEWQFAFRFTNVDIWDIDDPADLDRDGLLDALCVQGYPSEDAWVFWGKRKERETNLGVWMRYGCPQVVDLDGNRWMEIVMLAKDEQLKIWRFDQRERRLKVIAISPPLYFGWANFHLCLFDLDGDGRKEIMVADVSGNFWVFQWRDGKLKM